MQALAAALAAAMLPLKASGQDVPLWEFGIGPAGLRLPYYRGSDQYRNLVLPAVYFVYRGKFLRADEREGVRGILFESKNLKLNVSAGASLPVSSSNSDTRAGMPDLKPEIELGPALEWTIWRGQNRGTRLIASLPVRAAISIQWPPRSLGWITNPHLNLDLTDPRAPGWNLGLQAGPLFATRHLNDYYYSVDRAFATATRPAYAASGGYSGAQFTTALSKRFRRFWVGAFGRYDSIEGAVFENSPLVRSGHSIYGGIGFSVMVGESSVRVPPRNDD